jgi:hypothetical protein
VVVAPLDVVITPLGMSPGASSGKAEESVAAALLGQLTKKTTTEETREETPRMKWIEEHVHLMVRPMDTPLIARSPLTECAIQMQELMMAMGQLEALIADLMGQTKQDHSMMTTEDLIDFLAEADSVAATSGDLLSRIAFDMEEMRFESRQQARDTMYAATNSLYHSVEFFRNKAESLEEANLT